MLLQIARQTERQVFKQDFLRTAILEQCTYNRQFTPSYSVQQQQAIVGASQEILQQQEQSIFIKA